MNGSIVTFRIVGALALAFSATISFEQASYADNSNYARSSLLIPVRGGGGGGGGHGGMGGGFGGGHGGFGGGHGGFGFGGGHVGGMGYGSRMGGMGYGGRMGGMGRIGRGHGFHGVHHNHRRSRFFGYYDDYGYGCWWSRRYHRWVCPYD